MKKGASSTLLLLVLGALLSAACASQPPPRPRVPDNDVRAYANSNRAEQEPRFNDPVRWTKEFDDPARDAWQKPAQVISLLGLHDGATVVDIGAATGYFEGYLSRAVGSTGKVIALDVEPSMIDWVKKRAEREGLTNVQARVAWPADPGLDEGSIDCVLIVDTWHHLALRNEYAAKLATALKPGGRVVIVDFTKDAERGPPRSERIAAEMVQRELQSGGLSAKIVDAGLPEQYVVVGTK